MSSFCASRQGGKHVFMMNIGDKKTNVTRAKIYCLKCFDSYNGQNLSDKHVHIFEPPFADEKPSCCAPVIQDHKISHICGSEMN